MRKITCVIAIFVVSALSGARLTAQPQGGPPALPPAKVITAPVEKGSYSQPIQITGTIEALRSVTLASEVDGLTEELFVDEGTSVTESQPLLRLRSLPFELALKRAGAEARAEDERVRELTSGTRSEDLEIAQAELEKAKAAFEMQRGNFQRNKELFDSKVINQEEFDTVRQSYEQADAEFKARSAAFGRAKTGTRPEELAAAQARAAAAAAAEELARDRLGRATIRAPFAGVIVKKYSEAGAWLKQGDSVFDLQAIRTVRVRAEIPERLYNRISLGAQLSVRLDSVPERVFSGRVTQKISRASERSRAFPVRLDLDNADGLLAPGMLARITVDPGNDGKDSIIVPRDALVPHGKEQAVFRVKKSDKGPVADMLIVNTGRFFGEAVEVFSELQDGDQVVIRGNESLQPGQALEVN